MSFTIEATMAAHRSAWAITTATTPTGNVDITVDTSDFSSTTHPGQSGRKDAAINLLKEAIRLIEEGPWPLA